MPWQMDGKFSYTLSLYKLTNICVSVVGSVLIRVCHLVFCYYILLSQIVAYCCILLHNVEYCYIVTYSVTYCHILLHIVTYIVTKQKPLFPSWYGFAHIPQSVWTHSPTPWWILPIKRAFSWWNIGNLDRPNNHQSDKTHLFILSQLLCLHFQGIVLMQHLPMIANDELSMSVNVIASDTSWLGVTFLADFGLIDRGLPEPSRPRPEPSRPLPEASRTLPDASRLLPPASPPTARWAAAGTTEATLAWFGSRLGPRGCEAASLPPIDRWVLPISKSELRGRRRWRFIGIIRNLIKFGLFWIYVAVNDIF